MQTALALVFFPLKKPFAFKHERITNVSHIKTVIPKPNMNKEFMLDITPCRDGKINIYDISRYLMPYNGRERDSRLSRVNHEIKGKNATVYIIDHYSLVDRKQAIKLADRFIHGNFDTYRLD